MADTLAVAIHWPFVRRHLSLERARPMRLALDALAELQFRSTGELVALGARRLCLELGLSPGGAGAVYNALCELERRGVVGRLRDAGNRPDAWGLRPDLRRWRRMRWSTSGRDVDKAITRCVCSTDRAFAARNPGHGRFSAPQFWLAVEDHLRPPGLFLVDSRDNGATRAAHARRPGDTSVDSRDNGAGSAAPLLLSGINEDVRLRRDENDDVFQILKTAVSGPRRAPIFGWILPELHALASRLTEHQAVTAAELLSAYRVNGEELRAPSLRFDKLVEAAASPAVRALEHA